MPSGDISARRYAEAIYELARDSDTIDKWHDDLQLMAEVFQDRQVYLFFRNPRRGINTKWDMIRQMFEGRVQQDALNLLLLLTERERTLAIPAILDRYDALVRDASGIVVAEVTTAVPVDEQEQDRIAAELGRITGKTVRVQTNVNADIIGGLVARIGDKLIDGSVAGTLERLRQSIA